ncbi:hypothetical protein V6Z12_D03G161300 [Gossypium hirsutum]
MRFRNPGGLTWASLNPNNKAGGPREAYQNVLWQFLELGSLSIFFIRTLQTRTSICWPLKPGFLGTRQVSNWFINARVRVWKPMVEEIHMLESKGLAENNLNSSKTTEAKSSSTNRPNEDQPIDRSCINVTSMEQLTCSYVAVAETTGDAHDTERWFHDKPLRMDFRIPTSMEGSVLSFAPYEQSRLEMGGLGAVSLTLGLRHGAETAQAQQHQHRQQQYQSQEDQLQRPFGGQMVHDFAG